MSSAANRCRIEGSNGECWLSTAREGDLTPGIAWTLFRECIHCETLRSYLNRSEGRRQADRVLGSALSGMFDQLHTYDLQLRNTGDSLRRKVAELTILNQVSDALARTADVNRTIQLFLVGVTAGGAIGLNRALLFLVHGRRLVGTMGLGNLSAEEGRRTWMELAEAGYELGGLIDKVHTGTFEPDAELNGRLRQVHIELETPTLLGTIMFEREPRRIAPDRRPLGHAFLEALYQDLPLVAVPLCHEDEPMGLLLVDNFVSGMPIHDETIALLSTLANQATTEIVNNRLHADLTQQLAETEHLYELLRENQNYLLQHERLVDMGKLATTVAHEIKTPLVAIGGFARRARKALEESERRPRHELDVIIREVQRLERITAEILDYSKEIRLNLEPVDLRATLEEALEVVDTRVAQAQIEVIRYYAQEPCEVMADARRMKQVILNLLENAIDAMSTAEEDTAPKRLTVSTRLGAEHAELELADTGPGIPQDLFDRVFTPFFTTKATGSGLGLPVSRRIVADHGGRIRLATADGGGTRFIIELPRREVLSRKLEEGNHHGQNTDRRG
jgi:hypothetical protein